MSATTHPGRAREYQLETGSDLGREQLGHLETLLDRQTLDTLDAVGVRTGHRCLDLGAGHRLDHSRARRTRRTVRRGRLCRHRYP